MPAARSYRGAASLACLMIALGLVPVHKAHAAAHAPVTDYTLQRGDTLYTAARTHGVTLADIYRLNPKLNPRRYHAGQSIRLTEQSDAVRPLSANGMPSQPLPYETAFGHATAAPLITAQASSPPVSVAAAPVSPVPVIAPSVPPAPSAAPVTPDMANATSMKVRGARTAAVTNKLNTTGHPIPFSVSMHTIDRELGDVDVLIETDDTVRLKKDSVIQALKPILDAASLTTLQGLLSSDGYITPESMAAIKMPVTWNPDLLQLSVVVGAADRPVQDLNLTDENDKTETYAPAKTSAYVNLRTGLNYSYNGGNQDPDLQIDGALRFRGLVLEGEAAYRQLLIGGDQTFVREGTRLVYDDRHFLMRVTAGDVQPVSRGFQSVSDLGGFGVFRTYQDLNPTLNARPTGNSDFTLQRPSLVETLVNGVPTGQFRLNPGRYNLNNIPYVQGGNNVTIRVTDDLGMQQDINFSLFFDRQLLAKGLSEFGAYAGVPSDITTGQLHYDTSQVVAAGFYRRGLSDNLTAGGNLQMDKTSGLGGVEGLWASPIGTLGLDVAYSWHNGGVSGYALNLGFDRTLPGDGVKTASYGLTIQTQSENFMPVGPISQPSPYKYQISGNISRGFSLKTSASLRFDYSKGRGTEPDLASAGVALTERLNDRVYFTTEALYEKTSLRAGYGVRVGLSYRFGQRGSVNAVADTYNESNELDVNMSHGRGTGSWTGTASVLTQPDNSRFDGRFNYLANRAEVNVTQNSPFDSSDGDGQTTLSVATSLVMADGHFGIGRPVYDSFLLAAPHKSLKAQVNIEPSPEGAQARSGAFGPAVYTELSAYTPRNVIYTVPNAPAGYDIGEGSVHVRPPYRGGYLVVVGSDYNIMAYGTLKLANGNPVSLLLGHATELAHPERAQVELFTNAQGRFSLTGVRAGKWRIDMPTNPATSIIVDIPADKNLFNLGDLVAKTQ